MSLRLFTTQGNHRFALHDIFCTQNRLSDLAEKNMKLSIPNVGPRGSLMNFDWNGMVISICGN